MKDNGILILKCVVIWLALTNVAMARQEVQKRPNVLLLVADDLGAMDISPHHSGTFYETPNLERLAKLGTVYTQAYATAPVCSPSRVSLITGKSPVRLHTTDWFRGNKGSKVLGRETRRGKFLSADFVNELSSEEPTIAEKLLKLGYRTAFVGKWHLGSIYPEQRGYEVNIAGTNSGHPKSWFSPYKNERLTDGVEGEYLEDRLTMESVRFIKETKGKPFFLHHSFYLVHTPLKAPEETVQEQKERVEELQQAPSDADFREEEQVWPQAKKTRQVRVAQNHAVYAAMVKEMDRQIGKLLDALEEQGVLQETLIIFTSDNGGLSTAEGSPTSNLPLRGGKGWVYEGGLRVPLIIHWPGAGQVVHAKIEIPVWGADLVPTISEYAGLKSSSEGDGLSLKGELGEAFLNRALIWHYPHYSNQGGFPGSAIRQGKWKLIERLEEGILGESEENRFQLYDLENDPGETQNVRAKYLDQAKQLQSELAKSKAAFQAPTLSK